MCSGVAGPTQLRIMRRSSSSAPSAADHGGRKRRVVYLAVDKRKWPRLKGRKFVILINAPLTCMGRSSSGSLFEPSIDDRASCNFRVSPRSDNWSLCRRLPIRKINSQLP